MPADGVSLTDARRLLSAEELLRLAALFVRAGAWVLEELNRRIDRFTYRPESANLNDIIASSLNGAPTFAAGVEFYEARFKKDKGSQEAAKRMQDGRYRRACAAARESYPTNPAPGASLLLAPEWLFSHFPYGIFFPAYRRLCMPGDPHRFRVPTVMVHMAGLRNGQWGRRGVMRAFGVWHEEADKV
ncbi:hypothetical protein EMIHUDRAFT_456362 [Emiliania huxleyi CCMP1516]|uniref:Uncharacterized protein n=2 Tax=Emiliania huxleyi TaxID=2903 RepID=A0A0D3K6B6_EMIH1|nr:hypothetical protein EMIHUDRAFT_456362 [Emiliania huxleyi CCMP1516]EOD31301.1 hypothetical protein EMIHUDRAFT_456362 [Emiliania huxleyi CCMP1516]|eukprot:XP_005783730.1 hypothetical protein EMIHUDRAFT_456362 [Emiliania huxleyi CCMP1516]